MVAAVPLEAEGRRDDGNEEAGEGPWDDFGGGGGGGNGASADTARGEPERDPRGDFPLTFNSISSRAFATNEDDRLWARLRGVVEVELEGTPVLLCRRIAEGGRDNFGGGVTTTSIISWAPSSPTCKFPRKTIGFARVDDHVAEAGDASEATAWVGCGCTISRELVSDTKANVRRDTCFFIVAVVAAEVSPRDVSVPGVSVAGVDVSTSSTAAFATLWWAGVVSSRDGGTGVSSASSPTAVGDHRPDGRRGTGVSSCSRLLLLLVVDSLRSSPSSLPSMSLNSSSSSSPSSSSSSPSSNAANNLVADDDTGGTLLFPCTVTTLDMDSGGEMYAAASANNETADNDGVRWANDGTWV